MSISVDMVTVLTETCHHCGQMGKVTMSASEYFAGKQRVENGELIQYAFPTLSADIREQIISGTHPECWDAMFADDESDESQ